MPLFQGHVACHCFTPTGPHLTGPIRTWVTWMVHYLEQSDFHMTLKNGFGKCSVFVLSANVRKDQNTLCFPAKENPNMGRHSSIGQSCCSMMSKQSIDWFLESPSGMKFFLAERVLNQSWHEPPAFCIHSTNQSNHSISLGLLFLFPGYHTKIALYKFENRSTVIISSILSAPGGLFLVNA